MNKFWKWMEDSKYGSFYKDRFTIYRVDDNCAIYLQDLDTDNELKLILVGYMIEYISKHLWWEKKIELKEGINTGEEWQYPIFKYTTIGKVTKRLFEESVWNKNQYANLVKVIKIIDKEYNLG